MGKRELLLIVGFVILGAVVYQATAPAAGPDQRSTWATILDHVRREVRGNRSSVEITKTDTHPIAAATTEVRLALRSSDVTIVGEDRADIASELEVWSNGYDDNEARSLAEQTVLKFSEAGGSAVFAIDYPDPGTQRATLTLRVPAHLRVHVARATQRQTISGVAAVEAGELRGETTIRQVPGRVTATHRSGDLVIEDVGQLKLTLRGSDARLERVRGDIMLQMQSGELRGSDLGGPIEIESNGTEIALERLENTRGPIRVNASGGRVTLRGVGSETRIDSRNADVEIALGRPAPVTIYSEGEDVEVTPPPGGYTLDAIVTDGQFSAADAAIKVKAVEREQRASADVRGGGAALTLRVTRGDVRLRARDETTDVER